VIEVPRLVSRDALKASCNTPDAAGAPSEHDERTNETGLVELNPLTLTPYKGASLDHDITEDSMLVELAASLASSQIVMCPPPRNPTQVVTRLED
jgi:hypothetical protein